MAGGLNYGQLQSRFKGQYENSELSGTRNNNRLFLNFNFTIMKVTKINPEDKQTKWSSRYVSGHKKFSAKPEDYTSFDAKQYHRFSLTEKILLSIVFILLVICAIQGFNLI